jgi:hypothetical protein
MGQIRNVAIIIVITVIMGIITILLAHLFDIFLKPLTMSIFSSDLIMISYIIQSSDLSWYITLK